MPHLYDLYESKSDLLLFYYLFMYSIFFFLSWNFNVKNEVFQSMFFLKFRFKNKTGEMCSDSVGPR